MATGNDLVLARLEPACRLLAEARDARDAKRVVDLAVAAEVYGRRQKMSEEAIASATAVKVDAMALMGEFLKDAPKNQGAKGTGSNQHEKKVRSQNGTAPPPKLESLGIGKKESSDAQFITNLKGEDPETFEEIRNGKMPIYKAREQAKAKSTVLGAKPRKQTVVRVQKGCFEDTRRIQKFVSVTTKEVKELMALTPRHSDRVSLYGDIKEVIERLEEFADYLMED